VEDDLLDLSDILVSESLLDLLDSLVPESLLDLCDNFVPESRVVDLENFLRMVDGPEEDEEDFELADDFDAADDADDDLEATEEESLSDDNAAGFLRLVELFFLTASVAELLSEEELELAERRRLFDLLLVDFPLLFDPFRVLDFVLLPEECELVERERRLPTLLRLLDLRLDAMDTMLSSTVLYVPSEMWRLTGAGLPFLDILRGLSNSVLSSEKLPLRPGILRGLRLSYSKLSSSELW